MKTGMDNLARLGVGIQQVQERFEREGLPFSALITMTSDGGILVEAKFLLADVSFPIAWDHEADFEDVLGVVEGMYKFADDPRPTNELLDERVEALRKHLEELRELEPEIAQFDDDLRQAREEFQEFIEAAPSGGLVQ